MIIRRSERTTDKECGRPSHCPSPLDASHTLISPPGPGICHDDNEKRFRTSVVMTVHSVGDCKKRGVHGMIRRLMTSDTDTARESCSWTKDWPVFRRLIRYFCLMHRSE